MILKGSIWRKTCLTVLLALLPALFGCVMPMNDHDVRRGEPDYPQPDTTNAHILLIHGTADPSIDLRFIEHWFSRNRRCTWAPGLNEGGVIFNFSATTELPVSREGDAFTVRVPIDGVLPGRCEWTFGGVGYATSPSASYQSLVVLDEQSFRLDRSPNGTIDLVCDRRNSGSIHQGQPLDCRPSKPGIRVGSAIDGVLLWHPESTDLEVHFEGPDLASAHPIADDGTQNGYPASSEPSGAAFADTTRKFLDFIATVHIPSAPRDPRAPYLPVGQFSVWSAKDQRSVPKLVHSFCLVMWGMAHDAPGSHFLPVSARPQDEYEIGVDVCVAGHMPRDWPGRAAFADAAVAIVKRVNDLGMKLDLPDAAAR